MKKGAFFLIALVTLSLLAAGSLVAAEPPQPDSPTRLVPNRVIVDPGPGQDFASYSLDMGQIEVPVAPPRVTRAADSGQWDYVIYDTLVMIYSNTAAGNISSEDVEGIKEQVRTARDFYWRNSHFKLYLNLHWLVIDEYVDASEFKAPPNWNCSWLWPDDSYDGDGESPAADIAHHALSTSDFDSINLIWAHNGGTLGACAGGLSWLAGWWWPDGGHTAITTNGVFYAYGNDIWQPFHHEFQHSIDGAFDLNGNGAYFHADYPWRRALRFGDNWHFHAVEMRAWPESDWFDLIGEWGTYGLAPDADSDSLPDSGNLPVTEASLGSNPALVDSDSDGRSDRDEAMGGMFRASDLLVADSDGDDRVDGEDAYPLYALRTYIPLKARTINGDPTGWSLLTDTVMTADVPINAEVYGNWKNGTLYLMVITDRHARVDIMLDGNADGFWHGRDNYRFELNTHYTGGTALTYAGVNDCSPAQTSLKNYCQFDTDSGYSFSPLVAMADFQSKAVDDGSRHIVQLAIPADTDTGFNPRYGEEVGLHVKYAQIDDVWLREAWTFEIDDQVYLPLLTTDTGTLSGTVSGLGTCDEGAEPLSGSDVKIDGATGPDLSATTDEDGYYNIQLRAANGPYTLTVTAGGYETAVVSGVEIVAQTETVQDLALRREAPCLSAQPPAIAEQLRLGDVITRELTIENTGAGAADLAAQFTNFNLPVTTWANIDPITATLPAGGQLAFELQLDARPQALEDPGLYEAILRIQDAGPTNQQLEIPVSLHAVTYGVVLEAGEAAHDGAPGAQVPYILLLTNSGTATDTFDLVGGTGWPVSLPPTAGPLGPGEQVEIIAIVTIPAGAPIGSSQISTITAVSQAAPDQTAFVNLETKVAGTRLLLPVVLRE